VRRTLRFGLLASRAASAEEWRDLARKAEDQGYSTLFVADHFGAQLAPIPAVTAAAVATTTLNVGTFVLDNDFRHPAALAKEAATVELLTDGRFELGIGAGWNMADYTKTGIPFDGPGERVSRLEEALAIITSFFGGEPVSFSGTYYKIDCLDAVPHAKPKVLIGANGRRMLRLAARCADVLNFPDRPPVGISMGGNRGLGVTFPEQLQIVRETAGERYGALELSVLSIPRVTDQPDETYEQLAQQMRTSVQIVRDMPSALVGSVEAIVDKLQSNRDQCDLSYPVIGVGAMDRFAPIVRRLAGT
jgi:probable F420-dependent oxidoreductase